MSNLYEICKELEKLRWMGSDSETPEDLKEIYQKEIESLEMEKNIKLSNLGRVMRNIESDVSQFDEEIKKLKAKQAAKQAKLDWLHNYVGSLLGRGNNFEDGVVSMKWRVSEAIKIDDEKSIPEAYLRKETVVKPDKKALMVDLKIGAAIPGASIEQRFNLTVK